MASTAPDLYALLVLLLAGGRSPPRRNLLERSASPAAALAAGVEHWRVAGCDAEQCARLRRPPTASLERALGWCEQPGHHLIGWQDPDYPALLRHLPNPPLALF
ncbi:DNA processing protein DprA, partial [Xanthomonas maliensis]